MQHKKILSIFGYSSVGIIILRFIQLLYFIDTKTGFTKVGKGNVQGVVITYTIMAAVLAFDFVTFTFYSKRQPTQSPDLKVCPILAVFSFVMAVYMLFEAGMVVISSTNFGIIEIVHLLILLLTAVFFIFYGITGVAKIRFPKALTIAPIAYCMYNLISAFLSYTGIANISENIFEASFLCVALVFFLLQGKIISEVEIRKSCRLMLPTALFSFILGAICTIPRLLIQATGQSDLLHKASSFNLGYLLIGVYALIYCSYLYSKEKMPRTVHHSTKKMEDDGNDKATFYVDKK